MPTRADFYVGSGKDAEWIGSYAFDGYMIAEHDDHPVRSARTEDEYRSLVARHFEGRDDVTLPDAGWPWPWNDSGTTDYAYYWNGNEVQWDERTDWPDMSARKNVRLDKGSGLIVMSVRR